MITSPSRNDLATGPVRPHGVDVPVKVVNVSTAPTAGTYTGEKDLLNAKLLRGRYSRRRSMKVRSRAIEQDDTDYVKVLQI
jgi:hypothetical protein